MMIVAGLVLLLNVVDAVLITDGHVLHMASQRIDHAYAARSSCDATYVIKRILTPHGVLGFSVFADRHLQNGWKEHSGSTRAGRDLGARLTVLVKQMRQILASMGHQIVQGLDKSTAIRLYRFI